ncbi:MAG: ABC transporter substrate-binding protein, partial [Clostridia bacterium]|nr:ABC transporter substrate-binding protein [Clostridia bacterium]
MKIRVLALILTVVLCLGMVGMIASCGKTNYAENNTKIKIGASGPLTGGAAMYGIAVQNSAQLAVDEINAKGGLNGIMFELVMLDDKHDANNISTNYASLYEGGMQVSLGTVTTKPGLEFKGYANAD